MRIIKLGLISLLVLGIMVFLLSLLIPSHVRISRAMNIATNKDSVMNKLVDIRQWEQWNEMINNPALGEKHYSEKLFKGGDLEVRVISVSPDSVITNWKHGQSETIHSGFNLVQSLSDTTVVQWYFDFHLKWYPWEKFGSIIFDQQLGPPMERSLGNLKRSVEIKN